MKLRLSDEHNLQFQTLCGAYGIEKRSSSLESYRFKLKPHPSSSPTYQLYHSDKLVNKPLFPPLEN